MADRKRIFDQYAQDYHLYRPTLPEDFGSKLQKKISLKSQSKILEIGCGSGQATWAFDSLNCCILAIDIGRNLIAKAQDNTFSRSQVKWVCSSFEKFEAPDEHFDFIFSSMALHWIEAKVAYKKIAQLLKPDGWLAVIRIARNYPADLNEELRILYQNFPEIGAMDSRPSETVGSDNAVTERNRYFNQRFVITHKFNISYSAETYCGLMKTMSAHRSLSKERQTLLFDRIHKVFSKYEPVAMENLATANLFQKT